ncbi:MAG: hypothetical protein LBC09_00445 [Helicobacteraceae bacterium]|jgi:hypothetical protein|nr:hypothetical protein [Helicobacteraceae bacterium]
MKKEELKVELTSMRSLLSELEEALKVITSEEERLIKELDQNGEALEETKKLQERIERLLKEV